MSRLSEVCRQVLERITPTRDERKRVLEIVGRMIAKVAEAAGELGVTVKPMLVGSMAKDTWIKGDQDVDIFMVFPQTYSFEEIGELGLKIARKVTGGRGEEQYAEHPYLTAEIEGYTFDFVPCFEVEDAAQLRSSVDRTPLHTRYVLSHMDEHLRGEARLLKAFMKGIGVYGAELKVGGFSGYLCELLTIRYGSFESVLRAAVNWRRQEVIDIERHYDDPEKPRKIFSASLIVVDPVDPKRNAAAAVTQQRLSEFKAAAMEFLEEPSEAFFFPPKRTPLTVEELSSRMRERGTSMVFVAFKTPKIPPDNLWGQLNRSLQALQNLLEKNDFRVLSRDVWSGDEQTVFIFELESRRIPAVKRRIGPPVATPHQRRFIEKHLNSPSTLSGPRIDGDRWIVEVRRKYTDADALLRDALANPSAIGLGSYVAEKISEGYSLYVDEEVLEIYSRSREFQEHLTLTLMGRPMWLTQ
ncbi:MAG: CCA tRNA nucleotidyltransferase [Candidatus Freyarchaeota archaeon]|nr:CCA tRNA nucleotidyltransferase [Candidatus Jordarchaeia archaeon]